jgi:hypothetical protein
VAVTITSTDLAGLISTKSCGCLEYAFGPGTGDTYTFSGFFSGRTYRVCSSDAVGVGSKSTGVAADDEADWKCSSSVKVKISENVYEK